MNIGRIDLRNNSKLHIFLKLISKKSFVKLTPLLVIVGVLFLYIFTSVLVPYASGPDAGAHMVNTYCAFGTKKDMCEVKDEQKQVVFREVNVPTGTHGYGACFIGSTEIGASCAEPFRSEGINSISFKAQDFISSNNEVLFVQRVGRDIYSGRLFGNDTDVHLRIFLNHKVISPNIELKSEYEVTNVGVSTGPFTVGPIIAAPACTGWPVKNVLSISLIATPGETVNFAILFFYYKY